MEHIEAAFPIIDPSKNMTSREFQALLTSWYEEKGILSELRAQLRFKMINVLRNTAIGRDITKKTSQTSISLSKQAVNLIVAEFLMKNKCDYSLSIFNTEAGLSSTYSDTLASESGRISLYFDIENISNILELIGIKKKSNVCENILKMYFKKNEHSLLLCLINTLSKPLIEPIEPPDLKQNYIDLTCETDFVRQVGTVLMGSQMPADNILQIIEQVKGVQSNEIKQLEDYCNKTTEKFKKTLKNRDKQIIHLDKRKRLAETKLLKVIGEYNTLKHHIKHVIKDKHLKELEITKLKNDLKGRNKNIVGDLVQENIISPTCSLSHCDSTCNDSKKLFKQLQQDNQELQNKNLEQKDEITELQKKYTELLHDFHFLQKKVSLLNIKVNEESPSSHLCLNTIEDDMKFTNKENWHKKIDVITDSSDSITEEVIRQAWLRLEQLENESKEIEEQYKM